MAAAATAPGAAPATKKVVRKVIVKKAADGSLIRAPVASSAAAKVPVPAQTQVIEEGGKKVVVKKAIKVATPIPKTSTAAASAGKTAQVPKAAAGEEKKPATGVPAEAAPKGQSALKPVPSKEPPAPRYRLRSLRLQILEKSVLPLHQLPSSLPWWLV
ncbi:uncharacterized protein K441DRAFT_163247 [Cenococcum geophilum 1.58]|uniref:uncharacterized protein n=1 Tax=Cenococcum geophilum 1.58 TaxID=794803 RepID=UPI00358F6EF2|nr:hypothetical protein K441DRAFT_163247 [Cenococcum geophilum 1.58]